MKTVKVNPGKDKNGNTLMVFNHRNNIIRNKEEGTDVPRTCFYNRLIKDGDLVIVPEVKKSAGPQVKKSKVKPETQEQEG